MRGTQINLSHCLSPYPTADYPAARKGCRMCDTVFVDDREFEVTIEWRSEYFMPHTIRASLGVFISMARANTPSGKCRHPDDDAALRAHFCGINVW